MSVHRAVSLPSFMLGTLAALAALVTIGHFYVEPYNDAFARFPLIVEIHVAMGGFYLVLGALQFSTTLRRRAISYHRIMGRFLATAGLLVGASALFIGLVMPFSGLPEQIHTLIFGTYFILALHTAWRAVRRGNIARHRAWMIRAYAMGAAPITMRLIFIPALIITQASTDADAARWSIISFTIAFIAHALIAEFWLLATRKCA